MNLVNSEIAMISVYATCILLISLLFAYWKSKRTVSGGQPALSMGPADDVGPNMWQSTPVKRARRTRDGLALKVMLSDSRADVAPETTEARQPDYSSVPRPKEAMKAMIEAASTVACESAAQNSACPVLEAEEIALPALSEDSAPQAAEPLAQEELTVEERVTSAVIDEIHKMYKIAAPDSACLVQAAPAVEEIESSLASDDSAASTSALLIQEETEKLFPQSFPGPFAEEESIAKSFLGFHGLSEQPFGVTPDPVYLYLSRAHREALTSLSQGVENLRGFMALIAEPGMGKTTLLNKLMEELRDSARVVFLFQTQCNSRELLRYLLSELGVQHAGMDVVAMHRALNDFLFQEMLEGRRFVLVVDEAQNLQDSVLETLRLLSDFETTHAKLLQIVLAGQPQLASKLTRPNLSQLRQRIAALANLEALDAAETARYIEHRLRVAGSSEGIFTAEGVALIAERSQGIPRNINNICFNALLLGYSQGRKTIDAGVVQQVVGKLDLESLSPHPEPRKAAGKPAPAAIAKDSEQPGPARESQPGSGPVPEAPVKVRGTLTGKLTELIRSRPWSKDEEYRLQVLLEREPSSEIHVAERYYSCSFYVSAEQAAAFRIRQPIRIRFEQD
jgi:type II secretory pathway predicted ATPase ExeA